jgi:hypothetical protein
MDSEGDFPFRLEVDRNVLQGGMTYIDATQIDIKTFLILSVIACPISDIL